METLKTLHDGLDKARHIYKDCQLKRITQGRTPKSKVVEAEETAFQSFKSAEMKYTIALAISDSTYGTTKVIEFERELASLVSVIQALENLHSLGGGTDKSAAILANHKAQSTILESAIKRIQSS